VCQLWSVDQFDQALNGDDYDDARIERLRRIVAYAVGVVLLGKRISVGHA
jgi:hypothetical protein